MHEQTWVESLTCALITLSLSCPPTPPPFSLPSHPLPPLPTHLRSLDLLVHKRQRPIQALRRGEERQHCQGEEGRTGAAAAAGRHNVGVVLLAALWRVGVVMIVCVSKQNKAGTIFLLLALDLLLLFYAPHHTQRL